MENKQLEGDSNESETTTESLNLEIAEKSILSNLTDEIRKTLGFM